MSLHYKIINQGNDFENLADDWNVLLSKSAAKTIFLSWEWQYSWWQTFGGELFIVTVFDNTGLVAILPFIYVQKLNFVQLQFIGDPISDYLDFIIKQGVEKNVLDLFFTCVLNEHKQIKILKLSSISEQSPNHFLITEGLLSANFNVQKTKNICPYIILPNTWEKFLDSISSSSRYSIRRKLSKLEKKYQVTIGMAENLDEIRIRMLQFVDQHQKRMRQLNRLGAYSKNEAIAFQQTVTQRLFNKGKIKLFYLDLNNEPAASYYILDYQNCLYYYLSGFEPKFSQYSPSAVLLSQILQYAISNGYQEFDLMRGTSAYKFKWTQQVRTNTCYFANCNTLIVNTYIRLRKSYIDLKNIVTIKN